MTIVTNPYASSFPPYSVNSMRYDGINDQTQIVHNALLNVGVGNFSVFTWVRIAGFANQREYGILHKATGYQQSAGWGIEVNSWFGGGSSFAITIFNAGQTTWGNTNINITGLVANTWYHIGFTRQGTTGRGYLNGTLKGTNTHAQWANDVNNSENIRSGKNSSGTYLNGYIDEKIMFNKKLSDNEITTLYNFGKPFDISLIPLYANVLVWDRGGEGATFGAQWTFPDAGPNALTITSTNMVAGSRTTVVP